MVEQLCVNLRSKTLSGRIDFMRELIPEPNVYAFAEPFFLASSRDRRNGMFPYLWTSFVVLVFGHGWSASLQIY